MNNPNDLISRAAARDVINTWGRHENEAVRMILLHHDINAILAVDAASVVRCRDCKFYYGVNEECGCNGGYHLEDWFCADGERRDSK